MTISTNYKPLRLHVPSGIHNHRPSFVESAAPAECSCLHPGSETNASFSFVQNVIL